MNVSPPSSGETKSTEDEDGRFLRNGDYTVSLLWRPFPAFSQPLKPQISCHQSLYWEDCDGSNALSLHSGSSPFMYRVGYGIYFSWIVRVSSNKCWKTLKTAHYRILLNPYLFYCYSPSMINFQSYLKLNILCSKAATFSNLRMKHHSFAVFLFQCFLVHNMPVVMIFINY